MSRILIFIFLFGLLILPACNNRPEGVLSDDEMADLLTDLQIVEAYYNTPGTPSKPSSKDLLIESVLKEHGVTLAQLDSSLAYYGKNMDTYYALYDKVEKNLRLKNNQGTEALNTEADDFWPYGRFAVMANRQSTDGIQFSIPSETLQPGDRIEWKMRLTSAEGVDALLGVEYADGSSALVTRTPSGNSAVTISIQTDTAAVVKRVFGRMNIKNLSHPVWADSIRLVRMDFDSLEYSNIRTQKRIGRPSQRPLVKEVEGTVVADTVKTDSSL